jgi:RNA polymerase sigma-70 factor (ECF subfamily)
METIVPENSSETNLLLRAAAEDAAARGALLMRHRDRLRRMVVLRLDGRVQGRVDASDILQEVYVDALKRFPEYLNQPTMPFFLWLRFLTAQKLLEVHRRHLGVQGRDAAREISLYRGALPEATSAALAAQLMGHLTQPSQAAIRAEMKIRLQDALNRMDPLDREVLALRHFEQLNNAETARALGLEKSAASKRYIRALKRLKEILDTMPT